MSTRLNNFILWCKGWYVSVNDDSLLEQAQKILTLDDYLVNNHTLTIVLKYIDDLIERNIVSINLQYWYEEIAKYINFYEATYQEALIYRIKMFFAFEYNPFPLNPPVYSRKVYKLGFKAPSQLGNSYTLANYKAKKYFNKK
jgi:hypothetical protein